ncbi:MAG: nitrous oxide reductase accessory protein NosL [Burkholderiales bacterium]|nr:nitrous oxide reductase accessory protein NosL [Burkholderiales bacterium]MBK8666377.1 nitrous oxide reductase accessory protein NosL [Burkholderiales bacterium]
MMSRLSDFSRGVMLAWLLALAVVMPGCDRKADMAAVPLEIDRSTSCELDGMLLADYPGPKGQIRYAGQDRPAFFCDTLELLNTLIAGEQVRPIQGAWVQDMARADWNEPKGAWIDARTAFYVFGSKRHGSMGPTAASFAQEADAQQFAQQQGGKVLKLGDIKRDMLDLSGGALHDTRM